MKRDKRSPTDTSGRWGAPRRAAAAVLAGALAMGAAGSLAPAAAAPDTERDVVVWGASAAAAAEAVARAGGEAGARLELVGGVAARVDAREADALRAAGFAVADDADMAVAGAEFSEPVPVADHQLAAVNPGNDWDLDAGAGVGVALVDTGVTEVDDLRGRVVHGPDLSGEGTTRDSYGHGTFMAGLIAGDGRMSAAAPSRHVGVAPGAHLVSVKVAGADGSTSLSKVLAGIGWVVAHGDEHAIRVLNLSVAVPPLSASYHADPLSAAVEAAWASGITVVAASGNEGSPVTSPGRDPWVLTVGALDTGEELGAHDDSVPAWSGREALRTGAKPEMLAPGVSVVSLMAPGSTVAARHPESVVDGSYLLGSGTSMATALTAGAVAVLTEHHAAATPDDYKAALVAGGRAVDGEIGRALDLAAADLTAADAGGSWWQRHPVVPGLGLGHDRMPWATDWAGTRWAGTRWAGTRWAGTRWAEEHWAGTRWADASFPGTRWAGTRWAGTRWAEGGWAGTRWAGTRWAGTRWADDTWAGTRWAGTRWAGTRWADDSWAGTRWAGTRWAGTRWAGTRWADDSWAGTRWAGTRWAGTRWAGTRWAGTRWADAMWVEPAP